MYELYDHEWQILCITITSTLHKKKKKKKKAKNVKKILNFNVPNLGQIYEQI